MEHSPNIAQTFGCQVFNDQAMRRFLDPDTYNRLKGILSGVQRLDPALADAVADGMKNWALTLGATHYTHWFQPLTNITAGKHDSFLNYDKNGNVVCSFSGKELQKGEPDASSFPSGGLRATFEARGYTIWDSTSPAFVKDHTLYIPTAFCSYNGEALDRKTPLLRSMEVVSKQALRVLHALGNTSATEVTATVGAEQEYFLISRDFYEKRLDLKITGRTLFGAKPTKGQELDDHYCGRIRIKVSEFMHQLDEELWHLGVLSKTKHNEVAPAQHELAPLFSSCNTACDNNQLIMECMRVTAKKNGFACLLHEKPFMGVNGSGKHNNWSLSTDTGENLLNPGKDPSNNLQFLLFLCAVLQAVDEYADLIRFATASAGNDHRLGGNEAPPAIISIYLGDQLERALRDMAHGSCTASLGGGLLSTGTQILPEVEKDDTDRNRTSPIAFTGNKFEFRMLGSSASIASVNYCLNTAVAEALDQYADRLERAEDAQCECRAIISEVYHEHRRIIFNGDNYTEQWLEKARKRGLANIENTVDAVGALTSEKNIALFEKYHVFTRGECVSRYDIFLDTYAKTVSIEASAMLEMAKCQILPACVRYAGDTARSANEMLQLGIQNGAAPVLVQSLSALIDQIDQSIIALDTLAASLAELESCHERALCCRDEILPAMAHLRAFCDQAETLVAKSYWPFPNYTDLLHRV